ASLPDVQVNFARQSILRAVDLVIEGSLTRASRCSRTFRCPAERRLMRSKARALATVSASDPRARLRPRQEEPVENTWLNIRHEAAEPHARFHENESG